MGEKIPDAALLMILSLSEKRMCYRVSIAEIATECDV